jgi:hypothetical protein
MCLYESRGMFPEHVLIDVSASAKSPQSCLVERRLVRLPALYDLYIHPLYILVSKILSSILNSPAPIHPLYHPLSTLSIVGPTYHFI